MHSVKKKRKGLVGVEDIRQPHQNLAWYILGFPCRAVVVTAEWALFEGWNGLQVLIIPSLLIQIVCQERLVLTSGPHIVQVPGVPYVKQSVHRVGVKSPSIAYKIAIVLFPYDAGYLTAKTLSDKSVTPSMEIKLTRFGRI